MVFGFGGSGKKNKVGGGRSSHPYHHYEPQDSPGGHHHRKKDNGLNTLSPHHRSWSSKSFNIGNFSRSSSNHDNNNNNKTHHVGNENNNNDDNARLLTTTNSDSSTTTGATPATTDFFNKRHSQQANEAVQPSLEELVFQIIATAPSTISESPPLPIITTRSATMESSYSGVVNGPLDVAGVVLDEPPPSVVYESTDSTNGSSGLLSGRSGPHHHSNSSSDHDDCGGGGHARNYSQGHFNRSTSSEPLTKSRNMGNWRHRRLGFLSNNASSSFASPSTRLRRAHSANAATGAAGSLAAATRSSDTSDYGRDRRVQLLLEIDDDANHSLTLLQPPPAVIRKGSALTASVAMPEATYPGDDSQDGEGEDILVEMDDDRHPMIVASSLSSRKTAASSNTAKVPSSDSGGEEAPDDAAAVDPQRQSSRRFLLLRPNRNRSSSSSSKPTTALAKRVRSAPPTPSRNSTELNRRQSQSLWYHHPQKPQLVLSRDDDDDGGDHHGNSAENLYLSKSNAENPPEQSLGALSSSSRPKPLTGNGASIPLLPPPSLQPLHSHPMRRSVLQGHHRIGGGGGIEDSSNNTQLVHRNGGRMEAFSSSSSSCVYSTAAANAKGPQHLNHQDEAPPPPGAALPFLGSLSFQSSHATEEDIVDDASIEILTQETRIRQDHENQNPQHQQQQWGRIMMIPGQSHLQQLSFDDSLNPSTIPADTSLSGVVFPSGVSIPSPIPSRSALLGQRTKQRRNEDFLVKEPNVLQAPSFAEVELRGRIMTDEEFEVATGPRPRRTTSMGSLDGTARQGRLRSPMLLTSPATLSLDSQTPVANDEEADACELKMAEADNPALDRQEERGNGGGGGEVNHPTQPEQHWGGHDDNNQRRGGEKNERIFSVSPSKKQPPWPRSPCKVETVHSDDTITKVTSMSSSSTSPLGNTHTPLSSPQQPQLPQDQSSPKNQMRTTSLMMPLGGDTIHDTSSNNRRLSSASPSRSKQHWPSSATSNATSRSDPTTNRRNRIRSQRQDKSSLQDQSQRSVAEESKDGAVTFDSHQSLTSDGTSFPREFRQALEETVQKVIETFQCSPNVGSMQVLSNPNNVMTLFYDTLLGGPQQNSEIGKAHIDPTGQKLPTYPGRSGSSRRPYYNEAFAQLWLREMITTGMSLLYLHAPRSPGNESSDEWKGRSVQLRIVRGGGTVNQSSNSGGGGGPAHLAAGNGGIDPVLGLVSANQNRWMDSIHPKLQWSTMAGGRSNFSFTTSIPLLKIHSILTSDNGESIDMATGKAATKAQKYDSDNGDDDNNNGLDDGNDDDAQQGGEGVSLPNSHHCFLTITSERGEVHMFEADSMEDRDELLNGLRNVITRLSFHLITGDPRASVELYDDDNVDEEGGIFVEGGGGGGTIPSHQSATSLTRNGEPGDLPRLPNPRLNMNRTTHALLD